MNKQTHASGGKLLYIENIRILLTSLVIVVHMACTYGGPGGWTYEEKGAGLGTVLPLTILNAISQSFFMGMFFFLGAYFTQKSFARKGFLKFTRDRVIRLGIPLSITFFLISVFTTYLVWPIKYMNTPRPSFSELLTSNHYFGFGVMWFVLALIYFTLIYLLVIAAFPRAGKSTLSAFPKVKATHIFIAALILGFLTYATRIIFPLFERNPYPWLPFNLGHFPQYIFLFTIGIMAGRYQTKISIPQNISKVFLILTVALIVLFPLLFFMGDVPTKGIKAFTGGMTWESLSYSLWEQLIGISIMVVLLGYGKAYWNHQDNFSRLLSGSAYAVYVLHPPILIAISALFVHWKVMLLIKFLVLTPIALAASFGAGILIKKLPLLNKIF